jgi:hypothetical protein
VVHHRSALTGLRAKRGITGVAGHDLRVFGRPAGRTLDDPHSGGGSEKAVCKGVSYLAGPENHVKLRTH